MLKVTVTMMWKKKKMEPPVQMMMTTNRWQIQQHQRQHQKPYDQRDQYQKVVPFDMRCNRSSNIVHGDYNHNHNHYHDHDESHPQ